MENKKCKICTYSNPKTKLTYNLVQEDLLCLNCYKNQFLRPEAIYVTNIKNETLEGMYKEKCYIDESTGYYKFKNTDKPVHIWVMEKKIGRTIRNGEVVHHINGNKLDNSSANLMLFKNQKDHQSWHEKQKNDTGNW